MPHWTLPIDPDGLILSVAVGIPAARMTALRQAGASIPPSILVRALIDTGSDVCVVNFAIVQQLGLALFQQLVTQTTIGSAMVSIYEASLVLLGPDGMNGQLFPCPHHPVMAAPSPLPQQLAFSSGGTC
jgi:hypothetical protein